MLISIITVTYNAETAVARTMESVACQTFSDFEHIVMDGASADDTLKVVERLANARTRVFSSLDNGIYDAMNKGLREARGAYVLFLNAGDTFAGSRSLQRFADAIVGHDMPGIVYGQTVLVDNNGVITGRRHLDAPEVLTFDSFKDGMLVCHQAFMVRRDIAPEYDTKYRFSADFEWCLRCLQKSPENLYLGPNPVIHYLNEGVTTRNHKASLKERYRIMCQYYGRIPTALRHVKFATRNLKRKISKK